ncbi:MULTISPECIES: hypothetical protein [Pseudomonas]|jgi:hypothetical protein|uniref:Uncharacterized protein n=1 Tax=Pseudomonas mosselii TaxID=78327 RepID=A0A5R8Z7V3_9PSED|nr:hypothetical protein [Pseudomonas mosselii]TLP61731.1 hypothetical protein FEM01_09555 [Pseudomonas mosselii]
MSCALALFLSLATAVRDDGCTQAANPMQQHEQGATIFHLQVAPRDGFRRKTAFLLPFGANTALLILKRTNNALFDPRPKPFGRVAP